MKIKISQIKPGMVIKVDVGDDYEELRFILKLDSCPLWYKYLNPYHSSDQICVGAPKENYDVDLIEGCERKRTLNELKKDLFAQIRDREGLIDIIELLEDREI